MIEIAPSQHVDLEPDQIATATSSDSNRLLIELVFESIEQAQAAHDRIKGCSRGRGLRLNIVPTGVPHPRAEPLLRPMPCA